MKICKISGNDQEWLSGFTLPTKTASKEVVPVGPPSDVSPIKDEAIDDTVLAFECDKIEKCASAGQAYFYNKSWSESNLSSLREYAMVVGLPNERFVAAEHSTPVEKKEVVRTASSEKKVVEASKQTPKIDIGDAFKFEEKIAKSERAVRNWQVNTPSQKLELNPVMTGGVVPVRGGENYYIQNTPKLAANQNSMANPNAIEDLANSEQLDNGARLAKEKQERVAKREQDKKDWQQEIIDGMEHRNIVARGKVFPTEMLNAQPGLSTPASQRVAGNFNPDEVPEKTDGEMLADKNRERHASISRPKVDDEWEAPNGASLRGVSDTFGDALKKAMGK